MVSQKVQLVLVAAVIAVGGGIFFLGIMGLSDYDTSGQYSSITVDGDRGVESTSGDGKYYNDSYASVKAVLKDGYSLDGWYDQDGNKLSTDNPYTFIVDGDLTVTARTVSGTHADVYMMDGINDVLITSKDTSAGTVTIRAITDAGVKFTGWYSFSGKAVGLSDTITIDEDDLDSVVAKTDSTAYSGTVEFSYSLNYDMDLDTVIWIITDWRTGDFVNSFTGTSSIDTTVHPGKYDLRVVGTRTSGQYVDKTQQEVKTGEVKKTFTWKFEGETYSAVWTTDYQYYDNYQNSSVNRAPVTYSARMQFINYTSDTVGAFADYLKEHSEGMTDVQRANYVLSFVQQCIDYQYDSDFCGKTEYWKYPYETLYDGRGDCEDTTILYCAIMKSMGYDSAMLLYVGEEYVGNGHAAAGIALDYVSGGSYYEKDGKDYYYCETTAAGYKVGDKVSGYSTAYVYVV